MMNCHFHQDMVAVAVCGHCSKDICQDCLTYMDGQPICKYCAREIASSELNYREYVIHGGRKSMLFLFLLSFLPGLNYIYLGLIKRGLFFVATFLMATYITIETWSIASIFIMFIMFGTSLIDAFVKNGKMLMGLPVKDGIDDIIIFAKRYKGFLIPIVIFIIILTIIQQMIFFTFRVAFNLLGFLLEILTSIFWLLLLILRSILGLFGSILGSLVSANMVIVSLTFIILGCAFLINHRKK